MTEGHSWCSLPNPSEICFLSHLAKEAYSVKVIEVTLNRIVRVQLDDHSVRLVRKPDSVLQGQRSGFVRSADVSNL